MYTSLHGASTALHDIFEKGESVHRGVTDVSSRNHRDGLNLDQALRPG